MTPRQPSAGAIRQSQGAKSSSDAESGEDEGEYAARFLSHHPSGWLPFLVEKYEVAKI